MDKFLADLEQRIDDAWEESLEAQRAELRRLAEIRRKQLGRIEFSSAGATRER